MESEYNEGDITVIKNCCIYIFFNPGQPGVFKVGMSENGFDRLYSNEYSTPFAKSSHFIPFLFEKRYEKTMMLKIEKECHDSLEKKFNRAKNMCEDVGCEIFLFEQNKWNDVNKTICEIISNILMIIK